MRWFGVVGLVLLSCGPPAPPTSGDKPRAHPPEPSPKPRITSLFAGPNSACAIRSDGSVWCWGDVFDGLSSSPVRIEGLPPSVDLSVRNNSACAVTRLGELWCWGRRVGVSARATDGKEGAPLTPQRIDEAASIALVRAADTTLVTGVHTCLLEASGGVRCADEDGGAVPARSLSRVTAIGVGERHACALVEGNPWCWHHRSPREPVLHPSSSPVEIIGVGDGGHCGLTKDGQVRCWGAPCLGQRWRRAHATQPCRISLPKPAHALAFAHQHLCASYEGGTRCWQRFRLMKKGATIKPMFDSPQSFAELAVGKYHACGLTDDGAVNCWTTMGPHDVRPVRRLPRYRVPGPGSVAMGRGVICRHGDEGAKCWTQTGYPTSGDPRLAGEILNGTQGSIGLAISHQERVVCALFDGLPRCTRENVFGAWAQGTHNVALGRVSCAITKSGALGCDPMFGHDGGLVESEREGVLQNVTSVDTGNNHACAVAGGDLYCWGQGLGTGHDGGEPRRIEAAGPADAVATSSASTCVLKSGRVACWGEGGRGELGDGRFSSRRAPAPVPDLPPVKKLVAGWSHFCALDAQGRAWCWGDNASEQLGDGSRRSRGIPVRVPNTGYARDLSAGGYGGCVAREADALCWGSTAADVFGAVKAPDEEMWRVTGFHDAPDDETEDVEVVDVRVTAGTR